MDFPLSKREKKLLEEVELAFKQHNPMMVDNESEFIECKDIMDMLIGQGFVKQGLVHYRENNYSIEYKPSFRLLTDFTVVKSWVKDQEDKAKRVSKREWKIAIFSALVGLITGILSSGTVMTMVQELLKK